MTVLLVGCDAYAAKNCSGYMELRGYNIQKASQTEDALALAELADFIIIDVNSPDIDAHKLASSIMNRNRLPVLFLTESYAVGNMERALALGGDYVKKPYSPKELCLRIETALQKAAAKDGIIRLPPLLIDTGRLCVRIKETELFLTPREYSVLMALCGSPNKTLTNEALFKALWGDGEVSSHLVRQNVSTLRKKLENAAPDIKFIHTIHGSGYVFCYPPETAKNSSSLRRTGRHK